MLISGKREEELLEAQEREEEGNENLGTVKEGKDNVAIEPIACPSGEQDKQAKKGKRSTAKQKRITKNEKVQN